MRKVTITTNSLGEEVVSARHLYERLGYAPQHYSNWCKQNIVKNVFAIDGIDYIQLPLSGRTVDYAIKLDFVKKLSMLARTPEGEEVREYFIACEKVAIATVPKPKLTSIDLIIQSAQAIKEQEQRTTVLENKVLQLEAKTTTTPDYFTVVGFAIGNHVKIGLQMAAKIGAKAKALCKQQGIPVESIPDPRFGKVGMYPRSVLEQAFDTVHF